MAGAIAQQEVRHARLAHERGQDVLLALVERADVVMENFRPGTLERWNLGFERMQSVNPGVVLARISGYGQTGPYASRAGFASSRRRWEACVTSAVSPASLRRGCRSRWGIPWRACSHVQGILSALYWRDASGGGEGQVVDVSLLESSFALLESTVPEYDRLGLVRGPGGTKLDGIAPSNIFKSRDDKWMVIAANSDILFGRLCDAMGCPELADDERFVDPRRARTQPG